MSGEYIILTLRVGKDKVTLSMPPEEWERSIEARKIPIETMEGEHETRQGRNLRRYSWEGILPGAGRRNAGYVRERFWLPPEQIARRLEGWAIRQEVVRFSVSGSRTVDDVTIDSFAETQSGGHGDIRYSIAMTEHREIVVERKKKKKKKKRKGQNSDWHTWSGAFGTTGHGDQGGGGGGGGKDKSDRKAYIVKAGDTLSLIARRFLGSASRWREIYDIPENKRKIGSNPNNLAVGTRLIIPKK